MAAVTRRSSRQHRARKNSGRSDPSSDAIGRCHARWHSLFWGLLNAVITRDPRLKKPLMDSLKASALATDDGNFVPNLFETAPSAEIVTRTKDWHDTVRLPTSLRGQTRHRRGPSRLLGLVFEYYVAYGILKDVRLGKKDKRKIGAEAEKLIVLAQPSDIDKEVKRRGWRLVRAPAKKARPQRKRTTRITKKRRPSKA